MFKELKDKLEDGNGSLFIAFTILVVGLMVFILCSELGNILTYKSKIQVWADATANSVAAHAATEDGFNEELANQMYQKMNTYMIQYGNMHNVEMNIDVNNRYVSSYVSYMLPKMFGFGNELPALLVSAAKVEFVESRNGWIDPLKSFPADPMRPIEPTVMLSPNVYTLNTHETYAACLRQFYIEDRSRYNYTGIKDTYYGSMTAQELLLQDMAYSLGFNGFDTSSWEEVTNKELTKAENNDEYFSDGYAYVADYEGGRYIIIGERLGFADIIYCNPDGRGNGNASSKLVLISKLDAIYRSPMMVYMPDSQIEDNIWDVHYN